MSDSPQTGFGKFVPGFEFLQSLSQGATAALPGLASWVAPTLDPQELDKRIAELKTVQFWLDQNAIALKATLQALEVQKMTLATLQGMNFKPAAAASAKTGQAAAPAVPDPLQFWGALTQQFQQIAAGAMQDAARQAAAASSAAAPSDTGRAGAKKAAASKAARKSGTRSR